MSSVDNRIKEILDSSSLEERMASIVRVCDIDKWEDGEYHGNATEVAHILAKEVKRWMESGTAPLFKAEEPPTEPIEPCQTHHWMYRGERLDGRFVCERCGATQ